MANTETHQSKAEPAIKSEQPDGNDHSAGSGSYQVVARRYRPKTFEELVGQSHIAQALSNALTSGRVGHAYLFTGARGVGKTSTARIFSKSLNCVEGPTLTPCGVCDSCQSVSTGEDVDVIEIDGASNRGIDEIRQLRQNASICPSRSKYKIYIIDEVHMLTREAFNALLKTLEEPPEHVKFIFCTTEPSKIPITILSRCQRFDFAGIETSAIARRLMDIAAHEKVTADDGVFETLARRAAGSMRDAQSLLEQLLSFAPDHLTIADVHEMLGTANDQLLFRLLDAMLHCKPADVFNELDTAASEGVDFGILVEQLMGLLRDLLVVASGGGASLLLFCSTPQFEQVKQTAGAFGLHRLLAALQILDQTHGKMRFSTQGRVLTELALIRIAHLDHFQMITVLLDRLREGHLPIKLPLDAKDSKPQPSMPMSVRPVQRNIAPPSSKRSELQADESDPVIKTPEKPSDSQDVVFVQKKMPQASPAPKTVSPPHDKMTPQQRLAAATAPREIDLADLNQGKATAVWNDAIDSIPGMIGTWASRFKRISFEKPNVFVIVFGNKPALDNCQRETVKIRSALSQTIGQAMNVRFELEEDKKAEPSQQPVPGGGRSRAQMSELLKAASENPMIKTIEEVFGAELSDIE